MKASMNCGNGVMEYWDSNPLLQYSSTPIPQDVL
jgi:hypothetical protein